VTGSFLLGLLVGWLLHRTSTAPWLRAGLGAGFCGGFTTMSTLASDLVFVDHAFSAAHSLGYLLASLIGGIALAGAGYSLGRRWGAARPTGDLWSS
jgi:fluoride exporter